ncbi:tyrosine-protein kinase, partial [Klebsiella aerogenes]
MSSVRNKTAVTDSDEIDLGRLVGELIDHRKLIISVTSLFTLLALVYALFATPIYQADALVQVEQKQGNALLNSLSQVLPDSQPQSAPEIALLRSRMILGKTVDDLNLQAKIEENHFPIFGRGLARLLGNKANNIAISRLYLSIPGEDVPEVEVQVLDKNKFSVTGEGIELTGTVGQLLEAKGISLLVSEIDAEP